MAEIEAFRGVRFPLAAPADAADRICPPYDVIGPAARAILAERHAANVVRLELPEVPPHETPENNRYTRAGTLYREWLASGQLMRDGESSLYVYGQKYFVEGHAQERLGLIAALRLAPYSTGVVLPHEQTFPSHKEDRFRLRTAVRAQVSPIFGLYAAPDHPVRAHLEAAAAQAPAAVAPDPEGVEHRLWPVTDPAWIAWFQETLANRPVYIADGHHRYETALRYQEACRAGASGADPQPCDFVLTFLVEMNDPGLVLLPTHRMVHGPLLPAERIIERLSPYFEVEPAGVGTVDELAHHQIGLLLPGDGDGGTLHAARLVLRDPDALAALDQTHSAAWRDLDVAILHRLVLEEGLGIVDEERIEYTRDPHEARARVQSGEIAASFFLPRPRVEELKAVAGAGDRMPHKSTYFWPKAVTGLVIYSD